MVDEEDEKPFEWVSVSTELPKTERNVLAFYKNGCGMGRIVKAQYIRKHEVESNRDDWADEPNDEYCEESDTYFTKEGWYEVCDNCQMDFTSWVIHEGEVTHWRPLPKSPKDGANG